MFEETCHKLGATTSPGRHGRRSDAESGLRSVHLAGGRGVAGARIPPYLDTLLDMLSYIYRASLTPHSGQQMDACLKTSN